MIIEVLRLGHRLPRDERISTHVALVARAFGAEQIHYSGAHDSGLSASVERIVDKWGGDFDITYCDLPLELIREKKSEGYVIAHLTMYGIPVTEASGQLKKSQKLLLVVGSEHVPSEVYHLSDYNISVTSQPHSEVAALAIALDRIMDGAELGREFDKKFSGRIRINPSEKGKKIIGD
jgi:tRNA (cytidine56-2'-O)-methyltransferase